jgi:hypothetical protein
MGFEKGNCYAVMGEVMYEAASILQACALKSLVGSCARNSRICLRNASQLCR